MVARRASTTPDATSGRGARARGRLVSWIGGAPGAWTVWALTIASAILGVTFGVAEQRIAPSLIPQSIVSYVAGSALAVGYASIGLFLRLRRPDVVIGWVFIVFGLLAGVSNATWGYTLVAQERAAAPGPIDPALVAWASNAIVPPAWFALGTSLALLFPSGKPHRPIWGRVLAAQVIVAVLFGTALALVPGKLLFYSFAYSPFVVGESVARIAKLAQPVLFGVQAVLALGSLGSLRERYRDGTETERQQLKWFAWSMALLLVTATIDAAVTSPLLYPPPISSDAAWLIFSIGGLTVPISAGIAILRYRLYEIDRVISRTFVFGALTAILAGLYAASIRLFTAVFVGISGEASDAALVLTTLVLATSFTPIKGRLEAFANRSLVGPAGAAPGLSPEMIDQIEAIARQAALEAVRTERRGPS